jgi:transposase
MNVDQHRQDVAAGTIALDRLVELIASQQKLIGQQQAQIGELQAQVEKLNEQLEIHPTERLDESYSEKAEEKRKADAQGKPRKRTKPKRSGRITTAEKIARASRTEIVFPDGAYRQPNVAKLSSL